MKELIKGVVAVLALYGACMLAYDTALIIHHRKCECYHTHAEYDRKSGCSYFWCDHYNGK